MKAVGLILLGGILYVGANMWLDDYREHRQEAEVAKVMNSPQMANAQLDAIEGAESTLCASGRYECNHKAPAK